MMWVGDTLTLEIIEMFAQARAQHSIKQGPSTYIDTTRIWVHIFHSAKL